MAYITGTMGEDSEDRCSEAMHKRMVVMLSFLEVLLLRIRIHHSALNLLFDVNFRSLMLI